MSPFHRVLPLVPILLLAAPAGRLAAAAIPIFGSVVAGDQKIAGAQVTLLAAADPSENFESLFADRKLSPLAGVHSERDGSFELLAPETGFYRVVVEAEGYLGTLRWASAPTASPFNLGPIELVATRRVRLVVRDPQGKAVAGARVRLRFKEGGLVRAPRWPLFYKTSSDGSVVVAAPAGEEALAVAAVPGFALGVGRLAVGAETAEIRLEAGEPLAIQAVDARRRVLPDVAVVVAELGTAIGRTGRDGKVSVQLLPGQQKLELFDADGRRAAAMLPAPASGPMRVELGDPRRVGGQVVEVPGQAPVEGAWVFVWTWPPLFTRSDRGGHFELAAPAAGEFEVQAVKEGYRRASAPVDAATPLAAAAPLTLGLEPAARIEGRVKAGSRGVADAMVTASSNLLAPGRRFARVDGATDKEGRFVLDEVATGDPVEVEVTIGMRRLPTATLPPLAAGESRVVDFEVPLGERWACLIVDPAGNPVPGAEVVAMKVAPGGPRLSFSNRFMWDRTWNLTRLGKTDPRGGLEAELPEAGIYDFGVLAKGFGPKLVRGVRVGRDPQESTAAAVEPGPAEEIVLNPAALVRGQVVDASGQGLAGVELHLDLTDDDPRGGTSRGGRGGRPAAISEAGGEFSFREVEAGQHFSLLAYMEGYLPTHLADASPGAEPLRLVLHRAGRLEGKVASGGQPVNQAWLELEPLGPAPDAIDRSRGSRGFSDAAGAYSIDGLGPGRYRLWVHAAAGFRKFLGEPFEISSGEKKVLDVELEKAVVVFGKVSMPDGEPVAEAQVSHGTDNGDEVTIRGREGSTDVLGQYRIVTASPGAGWLRVERPGYKTLRRPVQLDEQVNEIDLVIEVGSIELGGRVIGPGGEPVAGAVVSLAGGEIHREIHSGADGSVSLSGLDPGAYLLQIHLKNYFFKPQQLELKTSRRNLEWQLAAAGSKLRGQILGVAERDLPDLEISARLADHDLSPSAEDGFHYFPSTVVAGVIGAGGRYTIEGLVPGRWSLVAASARSGSAFQATVDIAEGETELEQDLDFGRLAGPWVAQIRLGGKNLAGIRYYLSSPTGALLGASSATGRLELRAFPGSYHLSLFSRGPGPVREMEIEIGAPSEQVIELDAP